MGVGLAHVTVRFDAWKGGNIAPSEHQVQVVQSRQRIVLENVSPRLKAELIHPNREATLAGIRFSPDGRRIIAGSYPEGIIQLWEVASGRQLTKIETGYGYRSTDEYFFVPPEWNAVYVSREKRIPHRIEKDGKKLIRWEFEGEISGWDLATGELKQKFQQSPMRGIRWMTISPDGRTFMVGEELPGESEGGPSRAVSLVDARSGAFRELPGKLAAVGAFSPDSRTLAVDEMDDEYTTAVKLFDVATGEAPRSFPIDQQPSDAGLGAFSPDGTLFVISQRTYPERGEWGRWSSTLRFLEVSSGAEVGSFLLDEDNTDYGVRVFTPDGRTLATTHWRGSRSRLFLYDVPRRTLAHTVVLREEKAITRDPVFSPDGRWLAVATQVIPDELERDFEIRAEDVEQPRIHLVDVATGEVRETLVAPQGFATSGCFSPDGKTLATAGLGRVLLWGLSAPPGE